MLKFASFRVRAPVFQGADFVSFVSRVEVFAVTSVALSSVSETEANPLDVPVRAIPAERASTFIRVLETQLSGVVGVNFVIDMVMPQLATLIGAKT